VTTVCKRPREVQNSRQRFILSSTKRQNSDMWALSPFSASHSHLAFQILVQNCCRRKYHFKIITAESISTRD